MATYDDVARCQWLFLVYLIVDVPGALSQRPCTDANGFIEASSYFLENHTTAYPVQYGDCSFGESLCNYTQFCTDQDAESWRQNGDHAECPGKNDRYESFSVLLSPLLDISHVTCLMFEYTQELPGTLNVYLATTTSLFIIMPEEYTSKQSFVKFTTVLSSTAGKLMFRARSPGVNYTVQLRAVRLQQGSCTGSGFVSPTCTFERDVLLSSCGWSLNNWNITSHLSAPESSESITGAASTGYFAYVVHPTGKGTLTTSLVEPTESQTGCLEFSYILCGPDSRLLVSIETVDGNRRVLWSWPPNTSTDCLKTWQHGQVPVSSSAAFAITFANVPANSILIVIAVDSVRYTLQPSPLNCPIEPQHAQPRDGDVTSPPSSYTQGLSRVISSVSVSQVYNPESASIVFQSTSEHTKIDQTSLDLEVQEHASEEAEMALCDDVTWSRWLYLEYLIVCVTIAHSQRPCTDANGFIEASSYFLVNDTTAYPMQYGDCSFRESLCNYTQFCTDQDTKSWRQNGDHAECPGKNDRYESFSVLVSPLLAISHVTCLTFEYTQELPGTLNVYLATTTSLFIIMPEEYTSKQSFVKFTTVLSSTAGKLMFRARSPGVNYTVQLRAVRLQQGSCTGSGFVSPTCTFERDVLLSSCGWSLNNWNITSQLSAPESSESITGAASTGYFAYVVHPTGKGTLTTSLVEPTESQTGCLEFSYILCGPDSRLLVSIETVDGNRRVLWSWPPNTSTDCLKTWQHGQVPVSSSAAFAITFANVPANSILIVIAVDSVRYTLQPSPLNCPIEPQHAQPRDGDVTSPPSSYTQGLSRVISSVSVSQVYNPESASIVFQSTSEHTKIDQTSLDLEVQEHASEEAEMALCDDVTWSRWLYLEYLIVCVTIAHSQRPCTDANGFIEASSYFLVNDTTAYPMQYGDCSFRESLCNYTQFCTDQDTKSWRQNGDHAECPGKNDRYESFSVLVSPLLAISHVTCLTFEYTQELPGTLNVYLATTTSLFIIMPEEYTSKQSFVKFTTVLSSTAGKLMFRARSPGVNYTVQLRAVRLQQGSCTGSGFVSPTCTFERDVLLSSCGWSLNNWNITSQLSAPESSESITGASSTGYFAYVVHPTNKGTLTTSLVESTESQTGCLEFSYILCGPDSRLLVSIETVDGNRRVLWSWPPNTSTDCLKTWQHGKVPVSSSAAFAIIFENVPANSNLIVIAVDSVRYTLQPSPLNCSLEPQHAQPRDDDVTSSPSSYTQGLSEGISSVSSSAPYKSETSTLLQSTSSPLSTLLQSTSSPTELASAVSQSTSVLQSQAEHSDQTTPIIAGVVAAVVTVIVCIVVLVIIVIRKRRRQKQATGKSTDDSTSVDEIANNPRRDHDHPLVGMKLKNKKESEVSSQPGSDSYNVAEDGVPGSTRNRGYTLSPGDTEESCSISCNSNKNKKDVYSQVNKHQKEPQEMYAHVHKMKKKARNISSEQDSTARDCLNPSYAPETYELTGPQLSDKVAAATQDDEEYNALNFEQNRQDDENCSPSEATGQTYSHLQGDVLYDCAKAEHSRHGANMVVDSDYNHLVT